MLLMFVETQAFRHRNECVEAVRCIASFVSACIAPLWHLKYFRHFITQVIDHFYRNTP